jgi:hypothetical protein
MVRKLSKGTDIGDRISDMNREVRILLCIMQLIMELNLPGF